MLLENTPQMSRQSDSLARRLASGEVSPRTMAAAYDGINDLLSIKQARDSYGVVIDPASGSPEIAATESLRRKQTGEAA